MQVLWFAAAGAFAIVASITAHAGELPASGEVQIDTALTYKVTAVSDAGDVKTTIFEGSGIGRSHGGEVPFQLLAMHCLGHAVIVKGDWKGDGSCTFTDKDGDSFISSWGYHNEGGKSVIAGGNGKFKGMTGTSSGQVDQSVYDDPLRGWAFVGHSNYKWEVK
jgi:hypothetical protein